MVTTTSGLNIDLYIIIEVGGTLNFITEVCSR